MTAKSVTALLHPVMSHMSSCIYIQYKKAVNQRRASGDCVCSLTSPSISFSTSHTPPYLLTPTKMPPRQKKAADDEETTPVFFYGAGKTNGFMSQMFESKFEHGGRTFVSNEQYFHAAKAALFQDMVREDAIMDATSSFKHKELGKKVKPFQKEVWAQGMMRMKTQHMITADTTASRIIQCRAESYTSEIYPIRAR